ncbi:MAG: DMT family transporter, partial [Bacteroidota bacterium]
MPSRGILFILLATLSFSVMNVLAKDLSELHPMQVVFFRTLGTFAFIFPYMLYHGISVIGHQPMWLSLRALVGVISLSTFVLALQTVPLGSAISIRYLGPIFGSGLAWYFLRERIYPGQWLSFLLAFSGVLVLKGFDWRIDAYNLVLLLISAFFVGAVFVLIRFLTAREHFLTIINYFMVFGMVAG